MSLARLAECMQNPRAQNGPVKWEVVNHMVVAERRSTWSFLQREKGAWSWRVARPDGAQSDSAQSFETLNQCVEDASRHGYGLPATYTERRAEPNRPPSAMVSQEAWCPKCKRLQNLDRDQFVSRGDTVHCAGCNTRFIASPENVMCCIEDVEGLREIPLP